MIKKCRITSAKSTYDPDEKEEAELMSFRPDINEIINLNFG